MLAAYATCDDYLHKSYLWRFLNFKIILIANRKLRSRRSLRQNLVLWHERLQFFAMTSEILAERASLHCLLHIRASCLLHAAVPFGGGHAGGVSLFERPRSPHTTLTHGSFLKFKKHCCLGSTRGCHFFEFLSELLCPGFMKPNYSRTSQTLFSTFPDWPAGPHGFGERKSVVHISAWICRTTVEHSFWG